jgi:hypothetical protein
MTEAAWYKKYKEAEESYKEDIEAIREWQYEEVPCLINMGEAAQTRFHDRWAQIANEAFMGLLHRMPFRNQQVIGDESKEHDVVEGFDISIPSLANELILPEFHSFYITKHDVFGNKHLELIDDPIEYYKYTEISSAEVVRSYEANIKLLK